jgi:molybdenum-dependent DNA-binding transcriptional regulator ModE
MICSCFLFVSRALLGAAGDHRRPLRLVEEQDGCGEPFSVGSSRAQLLFKKWMTPFDDLELLRVLLRIVESGSISAAARSLKIPQPSLSRHLRTLESRAGARLLQRDTHHLHLTGAGQRLLDSARNLLALADEATDRLREGHATLQGHLRLFSTIGS